MPIISDRRSLGPNCRSQVKTPDEIVNAAATSPDIHPTEPTPGRGPCHTCALGSKQALLIDVVASSRRSFQTHPDL